MQACKVKLKPLNTVQDQTCSLHPLLSPVLVPLPSTSSNQQQSLQEKESGLMSSETEV